MPLSKLPVPVEPMLLPEPMVPEDPMPLLAPVLDEPPIWPAEPL